MKSIVLCGSNRFTTGIRNLEHILTEVGIIVFAPHLEPPGGAFANLEPRIKRYVASGLTYDHFQKIRIADVAYFYNEGGYMGYSTTMELSAAVNLSKIVYALADDQVEVCRSVLFQEIIPDPFRLIERLQ